MPQPVLCGSTAGRNAADIFLVQDTPCGLHIETPLVRPEFFTYKFSITIRYKKYINKEEPYTVLLKSNKEVFK